MVHKDSNLGNIMSDSKQVPHCPERIVGVHDGVNAVVHNHEPSSRGGEYAEGVKPVAHHC